MTIPLIAFLYLYLLFVLTWLIFSIIAFYHIIKYGQINIISIMVIFAYLAVSIIIIYLSGLFIAGIDWSVGLTVFQGGSGFFGSSGY